jgi:hypothetical protein
MINVSGLTNDTSWDKMKKKNICDKSKMRAGIYVITSPRTNQVYVGATHRLYDRMRVHASKIKHQRHPCSGMNELKPHLSSLEFRVLEFTPHLEENDPSTRRARKALETAWRSDYRALGLCEVLDDSTDSPVIATGLRAGPLWYESAHDAARELKLDCSNISRAANGIYNKTKINPQGTSVYGEFEWSFV